MAWYRCRHKGSGGGVQPIGDATDGDVLSGKTYMNANGASTGTMTNRGAVSQTLNTTTTSYTVPEGYHNGSGTVSITTETKTITAGTSASTTSATSGKVISSVTVNPTPSQSKSVTAPVSGTTTVSPDSGKLLSSVVVSPTPSQEKTTTPTTRSATAATVTPDSGKLLSKVTVNTNSVPNSNSGTKTITSSDTNWYTGNVDMGAANTFRYVNAVNVYNKGKTDGMKRGILTMAANVVQTVECGFKPSAVYLYTVRPATPDQFLITFDSNLTSACGIVSDHYMASYCYSAGVNSSALINSPTLGTGAGADLQNIFLDITNTGFKFKIGLAWKFVYVAVP